MGIDGSGICNVVYKITQNKNDLMCRRTCRKGYTHENHTFNRTDATIIRHISTRGSKDYLSNKKQKTSKATQRNAYGKE